MSFNSLELALAYLAEHPERHIFPIRPGAKFPPCLKDNLNTNCSNDPARIREWSKMFPNCNWGLAHKKSRMMVIDVDTNPKKNKQGQVTYDNLDMLYGFPETEMTRTPSGGFHKLYEGEHIMALGKNGLGLDIDAPNYVLIAGCQLSDGTRYVDEGDLFAVPCPAWIYDVIKSTKETARISNADEVVVDLDKPGNIEMAIDFLQEDAEPAIEGSGGDFATYRTACYLKDIGISRETAVDLLNEYYNPRCEPAWDREGLERKVNSAYTYSNLSKVGGKTAEADFADDPVETDFEPMGIYNIEKGVYELNAVRLVTESDAREDIAVREAAKPADPFRPKTKKQVISNWVWVVGMKRWINKQDPRGKYNEREMWDVTQFDSEYNRLICKDRGSASDRLLRMKAGGPQCVFGVGFKPGQEQILENGQMFNLYRKPYVVPAEGDLKWWNDHLEYLFPEEEYRNHLLNWMAWLVQKIEEKPKHALIIQGEVNGTGKSFIGKVLANILHLNNVSIVSQNGLSGRFNAWALQCKLIVVEELRAADRAAVKEALHDIITEDVIAVEKKGVDAIKVENCFGVMAFTNDDAALTLDNTDRRYLIVRTDAQRRSPGYYVNLFARLNDPASMAAVAYMLMNRDLGEYTGQAAAPFTAAKAAMQAASASDLEMWMLEHRDEFPFNGRLITVEDVLDIMPRGTELHSPRRKIKNILVKKFQGEELGQIFLKDRRPRVIAINGKAGILRNLLSTQWASIYEADKAKANAGKPIEDDDDATEEFTG